MGESRKGGYLHWELHSLSRSKTRDKCPSSRLLRELGIPGASFDASQRFQ